MDPISGDLNKDTMVICYPAWVMDLSIYSDITINQQLISNYMPLNGIHNWSFVVECGYDPKHLFRHLLSSVDYDPRIQP
jgi:hypothetical protein